MASPVFRQGPAWTSIFGLLLLVGVGLVRLGHQSGTDALIWGDSHLRPRMNSRPWAAGATANTWGGAACVSCGSALMHLCSTMVVISDLQHSTVWDGSRHPLHCIPITTAPRVVTLHLPQAPHHTSGCPRGQLCLYPLRAFMTIALQCQQCLPSRVFSCLQMLNLEWTFLVSVRLCFLLCPCLPPSLPIGGSVQKQECRQPQK